MYLASYAISLTTLFPIYYLVDTALKTDTEYDRSPLGLVHHPIWTNFSNAWTQLGLDHDILHSLVVSGGGAVLCVLVSTSAGFGLSQLSGRLSNAVLMVIVGFLMITPPVIVIPLYVLMVHLGLANTLLGAILAYGALFAPFGVYMSTTFFREIPREILEAARIDGTGVMQTVRFVVLPLGRPVLATLGVLLFVWIWNDLLFALVLLQTPGTRTAMVAISGLIGQYNLSYPALTAALLMAMVPTLLVFFAFQSRLQRGLTMGAVK